MFRLLLFLRSEKLIKGFKVMADYIHFRNKLGFIKWVISKGAALDLDKTMKLSRGWFVEKDGSLSKALTSHEFLALMEDKFSLGMDLDKSLCRGFKTFIIYLKDATQVEPVSVEEAVAEIESVSTEVEPVSEEKPKKLRKTKTSE